MAFSGGSLVSNILQKSSTLDKKLVESSAQKLSKKAGQLKEETYEHVRQRYVEFQAYAQSTADLREKLLEVDSEYRRLETKIEGELKEKILESADKRQEIEDNLRVVQEKVDFVQRLTSIHDELQASRRTLDEGDFTEAVGKLATISEDLKGLAEMGCEAKVFTVLQEETAILCSEADMSLTEEWNKLIHWSPEKAPKKPSFSVTLKTTLRVPVIGNASNDMKEVSAVVTACRVLDIWPKIRSTFANKLLHLAVKPLILNPMLGVTRQLDATRSNVILGFIEIEEVTEGDRISRLYKNLATVFKVVCQILPEDKEWIQEVGQVVCPEMTRLVIEHCLTTTVPKTAEELKMYEQVKTRTLDFEENLIEFGVVKSGFNKLSDFTQNIEARFVEQKRKNILTKAHSILKKSIHNTEVVAPPENLDPLPSLPIPLGDREDELCLVSEEDKLKDFGVRFPKCAVSKCVMEFVEVLHETLQESFTGETAEEKMEMFSIVRNLIDLYRAVFPTHHKEDIATIPAAAAVFYNNAMYITHHLIVSSAHIQQRLTPHATFIDLILFIRRLGEDAFQAEMKKQRESVLQTLKTCGNFVGVSSEDKRDDVYRAVRQGLFQITQLSRVYKETLPAHVHQDAVGNLLDVLVSHIVKGVLALEDIVSADASELHHVLRIVLEKGPSVMQFDEHQAKDLPLHCASWLRLEELAFVLNARLYEIVDHWGEGKGNLAKNFKPVEVRTLIKALFTNTDRRAAALTKITL